jgi:sortase (surface protein transpeptidase)
MASLTDGGRGRSFAFAASVALLLLGAAVLTWVLVSQQPEPARPAASDSLSQAAQAAQASDPTEPDAAEQTAAPDGDENRDDRPTEDEPTEDEPTEDEPTVEAMPRSTPASVTIPAIDVRSDLHALGLNQDGSLQVPSGARYDQAAWYSGSPTPGELGPAVIEGHVTSQGSVPSVFFDLGRLSRGDTVEVARADGSVATFEVYATDSFPKDDFPKVAVYGNTEVPELRLITCGGDYDPQARAHVDNIVVFAKLVSG